MTDPITAMRAVLATARERLPAIRALADEAAASDDPEEQRKAMTMNITAGASDEVITLLENYLDTLGTMEVVGYLDQYTEVDGAVGPGPEHCRFYTNGWFRDQLHPDDRCPTCVPVYRLVPNA